MRPTDGASTGGAQFPPVPSLPAVDFSEARAAYAEAITHPQEHHAEVGVLSPTGVPTFEKLGKPGDYGAHRVGSVTKTFTTFLALKLTKSGVLPNGLQTRCRDIDSISQKVLKEVFEDPEAAGEMTLEQLLSHTSGLEYDDHSRPQEVPARTLEERILQEPKEKEGRKFTHVCKPGDKIGFYSNAGYAIAGWIMEAAYNQRHGKSLSFAEIMQKEIFEDVFKLSESCIEPGPTGDVLQSPAGDMKSSVKDLMDVAARLQEGEGALESTFGQRWQSKMLEPRDLFQHHGIGCSAHATVIEHAGINREMFGTVEGDVSAFVQFPLRPGDPGLVAMCDSSALGPAPKEQNYIKALETTAGITRHEESQREPKYDVHFFYPPNAHLFHGNAFLATDVDPFAAKPPEKIICSRNGMKHELTFDKEVYADGKKTREYHDENQNQWLCILKDDGTKIIYSGFCLLTRELSVKDIASQQPNLSTILALQGVYRDSEDPDNNPVYTFYEEKGHLFMREDNDTIGYPCLYIPNEQHGGSWVVSKPGNRSIKIQFPENPEKQSLIITDIFTGLLQKPYYSMRMAGSKRKREDAV